jgi:tetratricopeptide (TPR) repeat protein
VLYLWRRSVVPCAIGHILNDAYPALFVAIVPLLPMSVTQHFSYDRQGTICYKKVEFDRSIVFYSRAIERNPRDAYAYRWRGLSYIKKKDYPKAFADLAQAMRIDPADGRPYRHRAFAYETQKDYPHALIDLRQAIALNPDDAASYEMRARIEGATQDWQAAAKDYTRAIHLDPTDAERYDKCAAAEDKIGAEGVAILYYRIATRFDRQDTLAWTRLATAYASDFRDQEALSALDHVFALEPDSKYGYAARSSIEQHREKYDLALADINKAIALDSAEPDWFVQRALILVAQKNYSSAIADYGHAIALKSDDPSLYERRADLYLRIQDYSGAMADWSKALQLEDGHGTTHSLIAWILATNADPKVRDGKRAIELATKSCELSGWKDGNPIDTLAAAYAEAGDFQHAIEFENRAIALMQDDEDWIEDARSRLKLYEEHQAYRDSSG